MITCRDPKHANCIKRKAQQNGLPRNTGEESQKASQMETKERYALQKIDPIARQRPRLSHNDASTHENLKKLDFGKLKHETGVGQKKSSLWTELQGNQGRN
jgi:hypothetical protein